MSLMALPRIVDQFGCGIEAEVGDPRVEYVGAAQAEGQRQEHRYCGVGGPHGDRGVLYGRQGALDRPADMQCLDKQHRGWDLDLCRRQQRNAF